MADRDLTADCTHLASLLCSRLCHDLLSPVGGMINGVELLEDESDPGMREQCVTLLSQGARRASAKLRFFRLAFGVAGGFDSQLPSRDLQELVETLAGEARDVKVDWAVAVPTLPKPAAKVLLNLAMMGIEAMPRGGTLSVAAEETAGAHEIALRAEGQRVVFDAELGHALDGKIAAQDLSAHTAAAELVRLVATDSGGAVQHAISEGSLILGAVIPHD